MARAPYVKVPQPETDRAFRRPPPDVKISPLKVDYKKRQLKKSLLDLIPVPFGNTAMTDHS